MQVRNDPSVSTRQIARQVNQPNIYNVKAWRILRTNGYKAYRLHTSQKLHEGDAQRRLRYSFWLRQKIQENNDFAHRVIWSDETRFTNCGMFNRTIEHIWSRENPRENREIRNQNRFGINVWAGLYKDQIIGPFIFEENLTAERYLHFLEIEFQEYLMDLPLAEIQNIWFHQDGAPPHNGRQVKNFLNREFPEKWIGNGGFIEWPARSPDLSPLDYFLWGAIKNKVYKNPINTPEDLRRVVLNAFRSIRRRSIRRAIEKMRSKIDLCIQQNGNIFEHMERR